MEMKTPTPARIAATDSLMSGFWASIVPRNPPPTIMAIPNRARPQVAMKYKIARIVTPTGLCIAAPPRNVEPSVVPEGKHLYSKLMPATLEQILMATRQRVQHAKRAYSAAELPAWAAAHQPRGFRAALERAATQKIAVIAELKKASPSKGLIRSSFPVARLASELEAAGAAALSVLTEEEFFHGSLANLQEASAATRIACLRKDFIVDEFQILEAKAFGADAVLLIVAALDDATLRGLYQTATGLGLDTLCEVHDER